MKRSLDIIMAVFVLLSTSCVIQINGMESYSSEGFNRRLRAQQGFKRPASDWEKKPEVREQKLVDWALQHDKLIGMREFVVNGIKNYLYQIRIPNQYGGQLGKLNLGNTCGPMAIRSCYYFYQHFAKSTPDDYAQGLQDFTSEAQAVKTFKSLSGKKVKLSNIHNVEANDILELKNVVGLTYLSDLKPYENLHILDGIGTIDTAVLGGMLKDKPNGYMHAFLFLPEGYYERATWAENFMDIERGLSHWISVFVIKAEGQYYWFIADSLNGNCLDGDNFNKIELMIYKLLGTDITNLSYYNDYKQGREAYNLKYNQNIIRMNLELLNNFERLNVQTFEIEDVLKNLRSLFGYLQTISFSDEFNKALKNALKNAKNAKEDEKNIRENIEARIRLAMLRLINKLNSMKVKSQENKLKYTLPRKLLLSKEIEMFVEWLLGDVLIKTDNAKALENILKDSQGMAIITDFLQAIYNEYKQEGLFESSNPIAKQVKKAFDAYREYRKSFQEK